MKGDHDKNEWVFAYGYCNEIIKSNKLKDGLKNVNKV